MYSPLAHWQVRDSSKFPLETNLFCFSHGGNA
jgi:hypothetical protein